MTTKIELGAIRGACLCGAVAFSVAPPYRWFAHCHCWFCRKHHGTLFSLGLGVAEPRFRWLAGEGEIVRTRATAAFERPYCGRCGSKVPARSHETDSWHVPVGLLDGEIGARPRSHIFVAAKSSLHTIADSLPQHAGYPPGIALPAVARPVRAQAQRGATGSCLCGGVAFDFEAPPLLVHCHCSLCRHSRGTGFSSSLPARAAAFQWRHGGERIVRYASPAPRRYVTAFCRDCGSLVPASDTASSDVLVPAGSLDTELGPLPAVHVQVAAKAPWDAIDDGFAQFREEATPEAIRELLR
jgi:hypothetical protein